MEKSRPEEGNFERQQPKRGRAQCPHSSAAAPLTNLGLNQTQRGEAGIGVTDLLDPGLCQLEKLGLSIQRLCRGRASNVRHQAPWIRNIGLTLADLADKVPDGAQGCIEARIDVPGKVVQLSQALGGNFVGKFQADAEGHGSLGKGSSRNFDGAVRQLLVHKLCPVDNLADCFRDGSNHRV